MLYKFKNGFITNSFTSVLRVAEGLYQGLYGEPKWEDILRTIKSVESKVDINGNNYIVVYLDEEIAYKSGWDSKTKGGETNMSQLSTFFAIDETMRGGYPEDDTSRGIIEFFINEENAKARALELQDAELKYYFEDEYHEGMSIDEVDFEEDCLMVYTVKQVKFSDVKEV